MKIDKKTNRIETISKDAFDKLPKSKKQIAVAKDVLDRIKISQLKPTQSRFCAFDNSYVYGNPLKQVMDDPKNTCKVCAKGGLFMSYIGIVNEYTLPQFGFVDGESLLSLEMELLSDIFTMKQLSLIETAFEGTTFDWNTKLTQKEIDKCFAFNKKYNKEGNGILSDGTSTLIAICKNIIANEGKFKP